MIKIYVGNLSYQCSEADLRQQFSNYGEVASAKIIVDPATGRSKGFAFVEMSSREGGESAIRELNGKDISGRAVNVAEARPQEKRPPRGDRDFGGGGGRGGEGRGNGGGGGGFREPRSPRAERY